MEVFLGEKICFSLTEGHQKRKHYNIDKEAGEHPFYDQNRFDETRKQHNAPGKRGGNYTICGTPNRQKRAREKEKITEGRRRNENGIIKHKPDRRVDLRVQKMKEKAGGGEYNVADERKK